MTGLIAIRLLAITALLSGGLLAASHDRSHAAGICEALQAEDDSAVSVSGEITEVDNEAGMLEIEDDCGSISVIAPALETGPESSFESCRVGGHAQAIGSIFIIAVDADTLLCE